ncbi:MAG: C4-type zinc ribbon domain-containing protein [Acidobacteriota bacterium]
MKLELEKLVELQITDTNIRRLKKSIETADQRRASIEQEFEQHAFEIRETQGRSENANKERAKLDAEIAEAKSQLERADRNLKNAQDQKQYETAMRDADVLHKKIATLETEVLEKMTTVEEVEKILSERTEEIASLEGNRAKAVSEFEAELAKNRKQLASEAAKRAKVFDTLPKNLASIYDRLATRSRDGIAVAEVKNSSCSACFMKLRPQVMVEIKMSGQIITCESCTRILYIISERQTAS